MKKLPEHIAIIMDGNGRWAVARGMPRIQGHKKGAATVDEVVDIALKYGIKYLTLYAFSLENWQRPKEEVAFLMDFLSSYLDTKLSVLMQEEISLKAIGRLSLLNDNLRNKITYIEEKTASFKRLKLILALSYGGRAEIVDAVKNICQDIQNDKITIKDINENVFGKYLYASDIPDPDLLIRTSGEKRISNFLLWQLSYAELYFTDKLWPDFTKEDFAKAIDDYTNRERRFGGIGNT